MEEETVALTSFGAALSLSTTLRHSIQSEITQLDSSSATLSKTIQNEQSIQRGIQKEMERAKREMGELKRGGGDIVESCVVGGGMLSGWRDLLEGEMKSMLDGPKCTAAISDNEEGDGQCVKFLPRQKSVLKSKKDAIASLGAELSGTLSAIAQLNEETNRIHSELNRLNQQNVKVVDEAEKKRVEYEAEARRNARVKDAIGRSRAMSGAFARGIAEKAQEQVSQRSANLTKEATLQAQLDAKHKENSILAAEEKKLDSELVLLSGLLDSFIQQHVEGESEIKRSAMIKVELEKVNQEVEEAKMIREAKTKIANNAAKDLVEAKTFYEQASVLAKELEAIMAENDNDDKALFQPALSRKAEASKEKEKLAGEVNELHKMMALQQSEMNRAVADADAKASILAEELKCAKEKLEVAKASLDGILAATATEQENHDKELKESKEFSAHLEAATQGEITRLDTMKRQKTDDRLSKLDQRRAELASLEDVRRDEIRHLRDALAFLERMKDVETAIKNAEIELSDAGEELYPISEEHEKIIMDLKSRVADNHESSDGDGLDGVGDRDDMVTEASPSTKRQLV
ncbi:hypothetical protein HJC23_001301 [Cyclotella cryptica]|uniref:Uncharacterized protein n=1 Tax=Cyclotella cryptica TaxID=29204 RepID=A0ABD3P9Q0_9STRA|eukprot:CCRYP_016536-RA/>CCRYP_016536-RA protein AED:0.00 eAED:0.00 QI:114/1/1/1/1/1/3/119/576